MLELNCPKCNSECLKHQTFLLEDFVFECFYCNIEFNYRKNLFISFNYTYNDCLFKIDRSIKGSRFYVNKQYYLIDRIENHIDAYNYIKKFINNIEFM